MNVWKKIGIAAGCLVVMFAIYYGSYKFYVYQFGRADKEKMESRLLSKSMTVDAKEEQTITQRTKLTVQIYNRVDGSIEEQEKTMPVEYIGMSREELLAALEDYRVSPSLADVEQGFEKYQVMSFSSSELVLRKVLSPPATEYKFYLYEENGCITVYYIDKKTVFEYTNILVDVLPDDIREQIARGKYVKDEDALYSFLETYSS